MNNSTTPTKNSMHELDIYKCFEKSPYKSYKHASYFQVYSDLFDSYRGKKIIFVEIGILNGGSLFMWRDYFGKDARIIGIDLNPEALKWEDDGFEIYIGNQADPEFWDGLFSKIGNVDIILDDGGHTNEQQIVTVKKSIPMINDGGLIVVEDTHASYQKVFGNPSKYSFVNYVKFIADSINARFPNIEMDGSLYDKFVYSVEFFESIVCLHINREKCFRNFGVSNSGKTFNAKDYRDIDNIINTETHVKDYFKYNAPIFDKFPSLRSNLRSVYWKVFSLRSNIEFRKRLKKHFR